MHRLLVRQLRKAGLVPGAPPPDAGSWARLLESVDRSYTQFDEGRYLMDQSMDTLSREMRELHASLAASQLEQAALRRVATAVAERRDLDELFDLVAREAAGVMHCESARVLRAERGGATVVAGSWISPELAGPAPHCSLTAPIRVDGAEWGALTVMSENPAGPAGAGPLLGDFAELVAVAISNAEDRARLAAQAATDSLTGLANHRAFQERLLAETGRARRHGGALALILLDLDAFKAVNDSLGHQAGDEVLVALADRMRALVRDGEMVARVGGEEFAWLLPESDVAGAVRAAERLRRDVSATPLGPVMRQTVSIGVCDLATAGGDPSELFRLADGALYWAKRSGRDMTVPYRADVVTQLSAGDHASQLARESSLAAIRALARAVDARHPSTRAHSNRVADLAVTLAERLGWPAARVEQLREAAIVHDVGKIGVSDAVLLKPGGLTPAEYDHVKEHAMLGARIVPGILDEEQTSWVRHHHERWDGAGYPTGLRAHEIPEGARIIALADAWDAMTGDRAHRPRLSVAEALAECRRCGGSHFDPTLVILLEGLAAAGRLGASELDPQLALVPEPEQPLGEADARVGIAGGDALVPGEREDRTVRGLTLQEVTPPAA